MTKLPRVQVWSSCKMVTLQGQLLIATKDLEDEAPDTEPEARP